MAAFRIVFFNQKLLFSQLSIQLWYLVLYIFYLPRFLLKITLAFFEFCFEFDYLKLQLFLVGLQRGFYCLASLSSITWKDYGLAFLIFSFVKMFESQCQIFLKRRVRCFISNHRIRLLFQATSSLRLHTVESRPLRDKWFGLVELYLLFDVFWRVINHDLRFCLKFASIIRIFLFTIISRSTSSNSWPV